MIKMYIGLRVKYPLFLNDFSETWNFTNFSKNSQISSFMKIRPEAAELFHANGRTDGETDKHDEANGHCSQFCQRA